MDYFYNKFLKIFVPKRDVTKHIKFACYTKRGCISCFHIYEINLWYYSVDSTHLITKLDTEVDVKAVQSIS
jgi:hypothetical protein